MFDNLKLVVIDDGNVYVYSSDPVSSGQVPPIGIDPTPLVEDFLTERGHDLKNLIWRYTNKPIWIE
jgi:hypothetical protein